MNAYELADILQEYYDDFDGSFLALKKSIAMLRQQADHIAELELKLFKVTNRTIATRKKLTKLKKEKIRAYDNGFEDGRKQNTQLNTQLHPQIKESEYVKNVKKAAEVGEQG